jgi:hypothetical protein
MYFPDENIHVALPKLTWAREGFTEDLQSPPRPGSLLERSEKRTLFCSMRTRRIGASTFQNKSFFLRICTNIKSCGDNNQVFQYTYLADCEKLCLAMYTSFSQGRSHARRGNKLVYH